MRIDAMNMKTPNQEGLLAALPYCLTETNFNFGKKGKRKL